MLPKRLRRVLAGVCTEYAVEVITTAISWTFSCACMLLDQQESGVLRTISTNSKLSERAAELVLRKMLVSMVAGEPSAEDLRVLVGELVEVARAS
jgi:hypothetical protein